MTRARSIDVAAVPVAHGARAVLWERPGEAHSAENDTRLGAWPPRRVLRGAL